MRKLIIYYLVIFVIALFPLNGLASEETKIETVINDAFNGTTEWSVPDNHATFNDNIITLKNSGVSLWERYTRVFKPIEGKAVISFKLNILDKADDKFIKLYDSLGNELGEVVFSPAQGVLFKYINNDTYAFVQNQKGIKAGDWFDLSIELDTQIGKYAAWIGEKPMNLDYKEMLWESKNLSKIEIYLKNTDKGISLKEFSIKVESAPTDTPTETVKPKTKVGVPFDVVDTKYEEAVMTIQALNIMNGFEDGSFKPKANITRAEFATVLARLFKINDLNSTNVAFLDVPNDYPAANDIAMLYSLGIFRGIEGGLFAPERPVSYFEGIKTLVSILGYDVYASQKGGYPYGYISIAAEKKMLKNIELQKSDQTISRGDLSLMLYNALEIDILQQKDFGINAKYTVEDGKNLLTERMKLNCIKGILTATDQTAIYGESNLSKKEARIGKEIFKTGNVKKLERYLGYSVKAYYSDENSDKTLVLVYPQPGKNNIISVRARDINKPTSTKQKVEFTLNKGEDKFSKIDISQTADLMLNGRRVPLTIESLIPDSGNVVFIDNDGDGISDVVIVTSYRNIVVDRVSVIEKKVFDMYNPLNPLVLDDADSNVFVSLTKDGSEISIDQLKKWDIISVAISGGNDNKKIINAVVQSSNVEGTVTAITEDGFEVNDVPCEKADSLKKYLSSDTTKSIDLGDVGKFYFDTEGKIAGFDLTQSTDLEYGYLFAVGVTNGLANEIQFKILNSDGIWKIFNASEKIEFNGISYSKVDVAASSVLSTSDATGKIISTKRQLITYSLNRKGLLKVINTESNTKNGIVKYDSLTNPIYRIQNRALNDKIFIDANTIVFEIKGDMNDDKNYIANGMNYFQADTTYTGTVTAFDNDEFRVAKAVAVVNPTIDTPTETQAESGFIVDRIATAVEGDEVVDKIYGFLNGRSIGIPAKNIGALNGLKTGDFIQLKRDYLGRIEAFYRLYNIDDFKNQTVKSNLSSLYVQRAVVLGNVYKINLDKNLIAVNDGSIKPYNLLAQGQNVYIYDEKYEKVKIASVNEIQEGDYVAMRLNNAKIYDIVILRTTSN